MDERPDSLTADESSDLERLIVDDRDFAELEALLNPFNIFEALGIVSQEGRHSDFLAFLCDPAQNHGLGDTFVRRFLQGATAGQDAGTGVLSPIDFDLFDMDKLEVRREWQSLDLLFVDRSNRLAVVIENKIRSGEHGDQLRRYWDTIQTQFPAYNTLALFLSPDGSLPSDDRYLPIDYVLIAELVESLAPRASADVQILMTHYAQMIRRRIVENTRLDELCRSIYKRHRNALDLLFEYRYDRQEEIRSFLCQLVSDSSNVTLDGSSKNYIRFCPVEWQSADALNEGQGWTPSGRMLLFQFDNNPTKLTLRLSLGPGPQVTRRRLLDAAIANPQIFDVGWKKLGKKWNTIFQREALGTQSLEEPDFEVVSEGIGNFWTSFLADSLPGLVKAIRSEDWLWHSDA